MMAHMPALLTAVTVLTVLAIVALLLKPGRARAGSLWLLVALLPVLVALTAALGARAQAGAALAGFDDRPRPVTVLGPTNPVTVQLSGTEAACLERMVALKATGDYRLGGQTLRIVPGARLTGDLPSPAQVQALTLSDGLSSCRPLRRAPRPE